MKVRMRPDQPRWTSTELDMLQELAQSMPTTELSKLIGRSYRAIALKCLEMNIPRKQGKLGRPRASVV